MSPNPCTTRGTSGNLPLRTAPITPAVPRSLERKSRRKLEHPIFGPLTATQRKREEKTFRPAEGKVEPVNDQNLQIDISGDLTQIYGACEIDSDALSDQTPQCSAQLHYSRTSSPSNPQIHSSNTLLEKQPSLANRPSVTNAGIEHGQVGDIPALDESNKFPKVHGVQSLARNKQSLTSKTIADGDDHTNFSPLPSLASSSNQEKEISQYSNSDAPPLPPIDTSGSLASKPDHTYVNQQNILSRVDTSSLSYLLPYSANANHYGYLTYLSDSPHTHPGSHHVQSCHLNRQHLNGDLQYHIPPPHLPTIEAQSPLKVSRRPSSSSQSKCSVLDFQSRKPHDWPVEAFDPSLNQSLGHMSSVPPKAPSLYQEASMFTKLQDSRSIDVSGPACSSQDPTPDASLANHVLSNFNCITFADCRLMLTHRYRFPPTRFSGHSLVFSRSPTLGSLLATGQYSYDFDGLKLLHICMSDLFVTPLAFEAALRVLYGEAVSNFTGSTARDYIPKTKAEFSMVWMSETLAFAAAGQLLQQGDVIFRGLEIAGRIINWDNLEHALSFVLGAGEHRRHCPLSSVVPNRRSSSSYDSDSSAATTTVLTPSTSQNSPKATFGAKAAGPKEPGAGSKDVDFPCSLLLRCLQFLATHLPPAWNFDPTARPLPHVDRLPVINESRSPLAKSRLSKIQFGDLPSEVAIKSSSHDSFISSILLSLPFMSLKVLVDLENTLIKQHLEAIIEERERRRDIVRQNRSVGVAQVVNVEHDEWFEVGYEERVEKCNGESRLARSFVGLWSDSAEPSLQ